MKKTLIIAFAMLTALRMQAAEQFVVFQPQADVISLNGDSISVDSREHSCVKRAVENLRQDFIRVLGENHGDGTGIIIGTVGVNKQIDQWVKKGELRNLKGKTEKYIIKTIGGQLVIAGSDKRGTVFGIYELAKQMGSENYSTIWRGKYSNSFWLSRSSLMLRLGSILRQIDRC